jgi:protein-arginine kinase activator protein McsA
MEHLDWHNFFAEHIKPKYELYSLITEKITESVDTNSRECILFDMRVDPYIVIVDKTEYVEILEQCLKYFVKVEEYVMCGVIRDSINSLKNIEYV